MRAVRYHEHGGTNVLAVDEVERPDPAGHELLVRVEAAGVNPVDTYFREGSYQPGTLPWIPGSDIAGVVESAGAGTPGFEEGDRVYATGLGKDHPGTYAEYAIVPVDRVGHLPETVPFDVGGGLGVAGCTSWRALIDHAQLEPAEVCLIHGGSGGVGHVAVQLAAAVGARVVTTARRDYHDELAKLGADVVLDYERDDLAEAVLEHGEPSVILDHRLDEYLQFDATVAAVDARVVGIGNTVPEAGWNNVAAARGKELNVTLMSMFNTPELSAVLRRIAILAEAGDLTARVHRRFGLHEAGNAQHAVMKESFLGKLVIEP